MLYDLFAFYDDGAKHFSLTNVFDLSLINSRKFKLQTGQRKRNEEEEEEEENLSFYDADSWRKTSSILGLNYTPKPKENTRS